MLERCALRYESASIQGATGTLAVSPWFGTRLADARDDVVKIKE